jgi:hypothetical protein
MEADDVSNKPTSAAAAQDDDANTPGSTAAPGMASSGLKLKKGEPVEVLSGSASAPREMGQ